LCRAPHALDGHLPWSLLISKRRSAAARAARSTTIVVVRVVAHNHDIG
jgi:hypothetical protein